MAKKKEKCWYCGKKPRLSDDTIFCEKCINLEKRDNQSATLIIYDKV